MVLINGVLEENQQKNKDMSENFYGKDRINRLMFESERREKEGYSKLNARTLDEFKEEFKKRMNYETETRNTDDVLKINLLTEENKKLKEQYGQLIKKTNILIDAYRKLKTENETFVKKKNKNDFWSKMISDIKKFIMDIINDIIKWFNS